MADAQLVSEVKQQLLAESQGVGEVTVVTSLSGINSLPALKGDQVVEAPLELLGQPAYEAADRADTSAREALRIANEAVVAAREEIDAAVASAVDTAEHPTYIGEDNYVYVWDKTAQSYNKTSVYVRGEGFRISKTYQSVTEMESDTGHGLKEGDFVLINTGDVENPDNAKIYVTNHDGSFSFLVDMSGAIGFTGKTPQLEIGEITVGVGREDTGATLTENGLDDDGNPKYLINIRIPSITLADLSEEEVALLQSPANEMIDRLMKVEEAVAGNEDKRHEAETARKEAEEAREESESLRKEAEISREQAEVEREESESERQREENTRKGSETARMANESVRSSNEQERISAESARVSVENARNTAEQLREQAEDNREAAEAVRVTNENARKSQETVREAAEAVRKAGEESRVQSEAQRQSNESARERNESERLTNESARVEVERQRVEDYGILRTGILEATKNANDAATESRNTPVIRDGYWWIYSTQEGDYVSTFSPATSRSPMIQNGTWWTWDDANEVYTDTGQSVSSEYVLSREKIEGVFTGNVETHWHDRYIDKVEGKGLSTEDFTTVLKEKLEGLKNYDDSAVTAVVNTLRSDLDTLVGGNASDAIESFNEIVAFLEGVSDTESLEGIIASIQAEIAKKADPSDIPTKVSQLENDVPYATTTELSDGLASKQPTIDDLETIRGGAALGATSLQVVPEEYVTEEELASKGYATAESLSQGLSAKQDKNLYFTDLVAAEWVEDSTYGNFGFRCDLQTPGVTEAMYAEVIFAMEQFTSVDYAPVCETKQDMVSIWAAVTDTITVPTIIIYK